MSRAFVQLDVFAARPGDGNPLAVVLDAKGLDDTTMQAIARWTRLPETTFVLPPSTPEASYRLRIFSPRREVPFAGHPSIGSAHAVLEAGLAQVRDGQLVQECAVGLLPIEVRGEGRERRLSVRAPRARVLEVGQPDDRRLGAALKGYVPGALPPVLMDGGRRWWLAELVDEASVRSLVPRWDAVSALARGHDAMGLCVFARCIGRDYDLVVRALVGQPAQVEDAASGAANATLAAYLHASNALPHPDGRYVVSQGREVGHDARLELRVDAEGEVWSGGMVQTVVRGQLDWP
ncbi:PhzF family phenazine biosynthesis protein [Arenimonas terrae]|uniref:PhzF family phenazine biosynthesis protein n=1 Tax=Arenimonas terrae TaxID=2546226 RepID=A0A5C4RSU0_9GAMM|nr:PhzF family phenazine biosynthesis protein [Arenimonas terrae]TNJ33667.1 PhzF family phenazine biosynthesis protein [Arenimonas terrae]